MRSPDEIPIVESPPRNHLKLLLRKIANSGRRFLTEEAKRFLKVYDIDVTTPYITRNPEEAVIIASEIGYPVAIKIASPDILHKSDVSSIKLNINSSDEVRKAFNEIINNIKLKVPNAKIEGVSISKMIK